ncbi:MAG TPA: hypothetical protein VGV09_01830 [Steroidobacteraceae bacterium]|nr:hypothetical protein [Steroidobacteraceae bacterium]
MDSASGSELRVRVGGRRYVLPVENDGPYELRVYPGGANAVLVAYVSHTENAPRGSSTLWSIHCAAGAPEAFVHLPEADFGHAELSVDGRTLFFTGANGVFALDMKSLQVRRLTTSASNECQRRHYSALDVVVGLNSEGALAFERGCGYEHAWHAVAMVLPNPGVPGMQVRRTESPSRPSAVGVAMGAGGWIWLTDGHCGDGSTIGRILVSSDAGEHWRRMDIKMAGAQPIRFIIADNARPGVALFLTESCASEEHVDPAWVYLTDDGGRTFRPIGVPPGIPTTDGRVPASEQDPLRAVVAPRGSLAQLVLYGQSTEVVGSLIARWESRDFGKSWAVLPPVAALPNLISTEALAPASDGGVSIRKDGVYRWQKKGETGVRIYPRN